MIRGFYTARSGLIQHQEHMNTISNNIANINTSGFKPLRTAFTDLMYQNLNRQEGENEAMLGHGVKINKNDVMMHQGNLQSTDRALDFALEDEGVFFAVQNDTGEIFYTRSGNFSLSNSDDTYYLVDANGNRVLDADGEEIEIAFDTSNNMEFDPDVIGVYRFNNPWGLSLSGGNLFMQTPVSGEAEPLEEPNLRVGYLEGSAVDIASEMVDVIQSSRAFSFSSRMIQVADEIEQTINSLR